MDNTIIIILAIFAVTAVSAFITFYIRKLGKEQGIETQDLEAGVEAAKDGAISELNNMKKNDNKLLNK